MVDRVVIHIGSDKAGSTAIQECLNVNRDWYLERGVYVPETGFMKMSGHSRLFTNINSASLRRELANEIREAEGYQHALLSWEGVHFFGEVEREELRELIDLSFPHATVEFVYYVRNQIDVIQSGVLQQIKQLNLDPSTIEDLNQPLNKISEAGRGLLFNEKRLFPRPCRTVARHLPSSNVSNPFVQPCHLLNRDIIDDFHHVIGLETGPDFRRPQRLANLSLSAETTVVLKEFSRLVWNPRRPGPGGGHTGRLSRRTVRLPLRRHPCGDDAILRFRQRSSGRRIPDCADIRTPNSSPGGPIEQSEIAACREFLVQESQYPTLIEGELAGRDLRHLNLLEGWTRPTTQGVWTSSDRSVLRLRPRGMHFGGFTPGIEINMRGRYAGRRDKTDLVRVNNHDLGPIDLTAGPFHVPVEALGPNYEIEIELHHQIGKRARLKPEPPKAFHLQALLYSVVQ